jgi:hypothetical protein
MRIVDDFMFIFVRHVILTHVQQKVAAVRAKLCELLCPSSRLISE